MGKCFLRVIDLHFLQFFFLSLLKVTKENTQIKASRMRKLRPSYATSGPLGILLYKKAGAVLGAGFIGFEQNSLIFMFHFRETFFNFVSWKKIKNTER
jgi:hypothetical protein